GRETMKVPQSLRDLVEGAESLVYVEDLSGKKGVMQAINPVAKLVAIIGMIIASLLITNISYLLAICLVPLALAAASRMPMKHFFSRTALIPVFAAVISIPILFLTSGTPFWATSLGGLNIAVTMEGLSKFGVFTVRVWFCVASLTLLILSTGFDRTLKMLSTLKVPTIMIQLFSLTYRYFFVSIEEAQSVLMAKEARTYVHKRSFNLQSLKDLGAIIASLFIRTYERSERVYLAMKARGFQIEADNKHTMPKLRVGDVAFSSAIIVAFAVIALL
ncbi:MAG TPA: cobalt ECF transporter T component CbiQ, partial [Candidatus Acidoferrales bacterium]|nr:cobalt ECF transporter T component CbiQ [Candidatus Acidoferrales bacterium]